MKQALLGEIIFWVHAVIVAGWLGLFFVPQGLWEGKASFHFFLTLLILGHQVVWGAILWLWSKKFDFVCILTSMAQWVRGEEIAAEASYREKWTKEFFGRFGISISWSTMVALRIAGAVLLIAQYLLLSLR